MENKTLTIKQWAEADRPREKLLLKGKSSLSDAELIGILLGSGTRTLSAVDVAKLLLQAVGNNLNSLAKLSVKELTRFKGIGQAKAITIVSALELGRRRKPDTPEVRPRISRAADVWDLMKPELQDLQQEQFWVLLLRRNHEVLRKVQVSQGGVSGTMVDMKIIFKQALEEVASYIIAVHNHPSGALQPSQQDVALTRKIKEAGQVLDIPLLDHVIFTDDSFYSFAEESLL